MQLSRKDYIEAADRHYGETANFVATLDTLSDPGSMTDDAFEEMTFEGVKALAHLLMAHTASQIAGAMKTISDQ